MILKFQKKKKKKLMKINSLKEDSDYFNGNKSLFDCKRVFYFSNVLYLL